MTAAKRAGTAFETAVTRWLRDRGFPAERLARAGSLDEGDVVLRAGDITVVFELKVRRQQTTPLSLGTYLAEAIAEAQHYADARQITTPVVPAVLIKRPGKPIGDAFVLLRLQDFVDDEGAPDAA